MTYVISAIDFLLSLIFDLISIVFLLALMLHRYRLLLIGNPVYRLLVRGTGFAVAMMPNIIGGERERVTFIVVLMAAQYVKLLALIFINVLSPLDAHGFLLLGLAFAFRLIVQIYMFSIFILVVVSWLAPRRNISDSPAVVLLVALTEPILRPLRNSLPTVGNLDFAPAVAVILLYLSLLLVYMPLADYALALR